jgi:hypothetical protein
MSARVIGTRNFTDGVARPVYEDERGQYVLDDSARIDGVWLVPVEDAADVPVVRQVQTRRLHRDGLQKQEQLPVRFPLVLRLADCDMQIQGEWKRWIGGVGPITHVRLRNMTKEEAIPIIKDFINLQVKKLKEAKDDKSIREAVEALEELVQQMKQLLTLDPSRQKA